MNEMIEQLRQRLAAFGPNLLAGLAVLVLGWLVALLAALLVRKVLGRTTVDNKIAQWMKGPDAKAAVPIEQWASKGVFYLIMLIVLMAFFSTIGLTMVTEPLNATGGGRFWPTCRDSSARRALALRGLGAGHGVEESGWRRIEGHEAGREAGRGRPAKKPSRWL